MFMNSSVSKTDSHSPNDHSWKKSGIEFVVHHFTDSQSTVDFAHTVFVPKFTGGQVPFKFVASRYVIDFQSKLQGEP
jgi:hypothetical protein